MSARQIFPSTTVAAALLLGSVALAHSSDIRTERVQFTAGSTGTTIEGRISGYEIVDYKLGAQAGQRMVVTMTTNSGANYFNLMAPGETEVAFFNGSTSENSFVGSLPASGDYTIRVYQMRSAARRNETATYRLDVEITSAGDADGLPGESADALVPGTQFHATGNIPCARAKGQPLTECEFGVVREGNGSGYMKVLWPDGGSRVIFFENGTPTSFDSSQADAGAQMRVGKDADLFQVRIGGERFEIPDVVLLGDNPY
jgi:hypothetical protein